MTDEIRILSLAERELWEAELRDGGLPSQSWGYAWGLSASGVEPQLAVVRAEGARMLLPFLKRYWVGTIDIATLPGSSGAHIVPASAAPIVLWRNFAKARGWIAG